jgi:hypothetical protein
MTSLIRGTYRKESNEAYKQGVQYMLCLVESYSVLGGVCISIKKHAPQEGKLNKEIIYKSFCDFLMSWGNIKLIKGESNGLRS